MSIKEKFLIKFPIVIGNKKEPYIILFDAFTGHGKSYISNLISKYDNSVILNNDEVRCFLNDYSDNGSLRNELQKYRLELPLKNNNSCIMDSCFSHNWYLKKEYYDKLGYKYYIVRLECSDDIVKDRLSRRVKDDNNYFAGNYNDYLWMKENVPRVPDQFIDYCIYTDKDVELQVEDFLYKFGLL